MSASTSNVAIVISARDAASAVLRDVNTTVKGFGASLGQVGQTALGVFGGNAITDIVRGIGTAFAGSVTQAADFQHAMSAVAAVAGANNTQLAQLSQTALALGQDTSLAGVNATDAAAAMQELAAGGVSVSDIMGGAARGALLLASAGGLDFASAADIAANSMNAFGLKGQDVAHIADLFAAAANASSANVQDIGYSMQYVGPIAASLGLSIEDTTAALAELGSQGIRGEQAGTTLRSMFVALASPTKAAQKVMTDLGLSFFDSQGRMKDMAGIAQELNTHLAGLTEQQRAAALSTLFSNAALSGSTIIANEGAAGIQNYLAQVNIAGSAAENGRIRNDNLAGSFEQLKSTVQTAAIAFGTQLLPVLRSVVDTATGVVNAAIPRIQAFGAGIASVFTTITGAVGGLGGPILAIVAAIGGALAALAALGGALVAGGIAAGLIGTALSTIGSVLAPLIPVFLAVGAILGGLALAWRLNLGGLRDFTTGLATLARSVPDMATALVRAFATGDFNSAFGPIITAIDNAFGSQAAGKLTLFVSNALKVGQVLRDSFLTFREALAGDWFGGQTEGINVWVRTVGRATQLGRDAVLTFIQAFQGDWAGQSTTSINGFVRVAGILGQTVRQVATWFRDTALPALGQFAAFVVAQAIPAIGRFAAFLSGTAAPAIAAFVQTAVGYVQQFAAFLSDTAVPAIAAFAQQASGYVQQFAGFVRDHFDQIAKTVAIAVAAFAAFQVLSTIAGTIAGVVTAINGVVGAISAAGGVVAAVVAVLGGPVTLALAAIIGLSALFAAAWLNDWGGIREIVASVGAGLQAFGTLIGSAIKPAIDLLGQTLASQAAPLAALRASWDQLVTAIRPALPVLTAIVEGIGALLAGVFFTAIALLVGEIRGFIELLAGALPGALLAVQGVVDVVSGVIQLIVGAVQSGLTILQDLLHGDWDKMWADMGASLTNTWNSIVQILTGIAEIIIGVISALVFGVLGYIDGLVSGVIGFFQGLYDALVGHSIIPDLVNGILAWFGALVTAIPTLLVGMLTSFAAWAAALFTIGQAVAELLLTVFGNLGRDLGVLLAKGLLDGVIGLLTAIDSALPDWIKKFIPGYASVNVDALRGLNANLTTTPLLSSQDTQSFDDKIATAIAKAQAAQPPANQTTNVYVTGNTGIGIDEWTTRIANSLTPKLAAGAAGNTGGLK